jgi:Uncharacterised nucleotidyltransferase
MHAEAMLVAALSRTPLTDSSRHRLLGLVTSDLDWDAVRDLAISWRVEPTVFGNMRMAFASVIPERMLSASLDLERQARAQTLSRTMLLVRLVEQLESAGIAAIVLKGPAISIAAYDDYSLRTFSDADILLKTEELPAARDLLVSLGYEREYPPEIERRLITDGHALEFADARLRVEMHPRLLSRHLRFELEPADLWRAARRVKCLDREIRILSAPHLFLYLCAHGAKHEWALFRWICDIAQLEARMTPTEASRIVELANRTNTRRILALALRLTRETFGDDRSPFSARALLAEGETRSLVELVLRRLDIGSSDAGSILPRRLAAAHAYAGPLAFWLLSRERLRDRAGCTARFIFLPAASDMGQGRARRWFRPVRLAGNALRRMIYSGSDTSSALD